jgi:hypothetical protein
VVPKCDMAPVRPKQTNESNRPSRKARSSPKRLPSMPITSYLKAPIYFRMNMPTEAVLPRQSVSPRPGPSSRVQSETGNHLSSDRKLEKRKKKRHSKHSRDQDRSHKHRKKTRDASKSQSRHEPPRVSSGPRSSSESDDRPTTLVSGRAGGTRATSPA